MTYQTRLFVPEDKDSFEDLYRAVYGQNWIDKTRLEWSLERPLSHGGAVIAVDANAVVSAQPYCDLPLHTPSGFRRATLFLDVVTHPAHQRRGLFTKVVSAATMAAFERGSSIIITTPNRISLLGFEKIPGWLRLFTLGCIFLPLGPGDPAGRSGLAVPPIRAALALASRFCKVPNVTELSCLTDYRIESPWLPGSDADVLWTRFSARVDNTIARNADFLRWRFGPNYRLFLFLNSHGPVGYAAARVITRVGLKIGVILDFVTTDNEVSAHSLLVPVIDWMREQGASAVMAYFLNNSMPWNQLRAAGFLRVPRFCTPRHYLVCVNVHPGEPCASALLNPLSWHFSLADSDLV